METYDSSIDYEVQGYFYNQSSICLNIPNGFDTLFNLAGSYTLAELRDLYTPVGCKHARTELNYTPPWIDEELLAYSLRGLSAIRV